MSTNKKVTPLVEGVSDAEYGQPAQTARQFQARGLLYLKDNSEAKDEKSQPIHKQDKLVVKSKEFL